MNFQNRAEPIRLFSISFFSSIVKHELAVYNYEKQLDYTLKPSLLTFCHRLAFVLIHNLCFFHHLPLFVKYFYLLNPVYL